MNNTNLTLHINMYTSTAYLHKTLEVSRLIHVVSMYISIGAAQPHKKIKDTCALKLQRLVVGQKLCSNFSIWTFPDTKAFPFVVKERAVDLVVAKLPILAGLHDRSRALHFFCFNGVKGRFAMNVKHGELCGKSDCGRCDR